MTFKHYMQQIFGIALANGLVLAVLLAITMALVGDTSAEINADIGFERFDGLWLLPGLPLVLITLSLLLSPVAYLIYRLICRVPGLGSSSAR